MAILIRSASLTGFSEVARRSGLDASALLSEIGLPQHCLFDPDLRIPADAVRALLELAAERSDDESFALRMAETRRASNLGPLVLLMREEPTLRRALDALARFGRFQNEAIFLRIEQAGNVVILREELITGHGAPVRQGTELALAVLFRLLQMLLGPQWRPQQVCFAHLAPRDRSVHLSIFGEGVLRFGQDFNGIVCATRDLDRPNPGADPVLGRYARQMLQEALSAEAGSMLQSLRPLVATLLPGGRCTATVVAQHLGVDRRTIHRHLARSGQTFGSVVDELRRELAQRYIADRSRPLSNISALLGFSAPSAFTRWYIQRFGMPPSACRAGAKRPKRDSGSNPPLPRGG